MGKMQAKPRKRKERKRVPMNMKPGDKIRLSRRVRAVVEVPRDVLVWREREKSDDTL